LLKFLGLSFTASGGNDMHTAAFGAGAGILAGLGTFVGLAGHISPVWAEWAALLCTGGAMVVASSLLDLKKAGGLLGETKRAHI
jgi:hypothetical protein